MNIKNKPPSPELGNYHSNTLPPYKGHEETLGEDSSGQKFNLPTSLADDLKMLSDMEGRSKTEIVKNALLHYFYFSHLWNNKKFFIKSKKRVDSPITYVDLEKEVDSTRVSVMWCSNEDDPRENCFLVACRILALKEGTVIINPVFYLNSPSEEALLVKSNVVKADFYGFEPNGSGPQSYPYLHNLKYEIEYQYIWSILPN